MTFRILLLLLIGLSHLHGSAQNLIVVDSSNTPIAYISVYSSNQIVGYTDSTGTILIPEEYRNDTLIIKGIKYLPRTVYLPGLSNSDFRVTLALNPIYCGIAIDPVNILPLRVQRLKQDLAMRIEYITIDQISQIQPQTAADLLTIDGDVYVQKSQMGGGSPMIRGFATNRILLTVDHVRMNNAIFRSGNVHNVISIDPFTVQRADVIFGPASQFYGSDAIGGVLNFNTLRPRFSGTDSFNFDLNGTLRVSSANTERTWHVDAASKWKKVGMINSVSFSHFGNLNMGKNGPDFYTNPKIVYPLEDRDTVVDNQNPNLQIFSNYRQFNTLHKIRYRPSEDWDFDYAFHMSYLSDIPRFDRLRQLDSDSTPVYAEWYYGPQTWRMHHLSTEHKMDKVFADFMEISLARQFYRESRNTRLLYADELKMRTEEVQAHSLNVDFQKFKHQNESQNLKIFYGLELIHNRVNSRAQQENRNDFSLTPISTRYPDGSDWFSGGVYFNLVKEFSKLYKAEGTIRYSHFALSDEFDTSFIPLPVSSFSISTGALTGSISHLFNLSKRFKLAAVTSTAFRAPNIDDVSKVFDSQPGIVIIPNTALGAEYAYNAEINLEYRVKSIFKFRGTFFGTILNNAIGLSTTQLQGQDSIVYDGVLSEVQQLSNMNSAWIAGTQLSLKVNFDPFELRSSYTVMQSNSSLGIPLAHITPNFGATHIVFKQNRFTVDLFSQYNQSFSFDQFAQSEKQNPQIYLKDENGIPYAPSWFTLNARFNYYFTETRVLLVGVDNILNKRYRPYGSGITAPGFNVIISVRTQF
ncbi:TonB-dependent receptor [bacterium]|nr:TonB-dependent receptor [bacterium]